MLRRPAATADDRYDALANALRAVVDDVVSRVAAAAQPAGHSNEVTVSIPEAARRLGIGTTKLKELIAAREIQSVKVGERRLVPVSALEAFSAGVISTRRLATGHPAPESSRVHLADAANRTQSPRVVPHR